MTDPGIPVFDTDHFADVCGDDPGFQREIIGDFLSQFDSRLNDITLAVGLRDPVAVRQAAHALRGSAASLGARALAEASDRIEALGRAQALDGAPAALQQVLDEAGRLREALAAHLRERAA
jgi:HPt (histidine-containing phosphotransfer) domain-containing protein